MAYKYNIQYVNFYTDGSAARKIAPAKQTPKVVLPKPKKRKRQVIYVDPIACLGTFVAVCMLVMMFVGLVQLHNEKVQAEAMNNYLEHLQQENMQLSDEFEAGYNPEEVERAALALGMVPQSQVPHTVVNVPAQEMPQQETAKVTILTKIYTVINGLFA